MNILTKLKQGGAGALVQWLEEGTHNQRVMSLNHGTGYCIDIFHIDLFQNLYYLLEKTKNKQKEVEDGPFKKLTWVIKYIASLHIPR